MSDFGKLLSVTIEFIYATEKSSDPEYPSAVFINIPDYLIAKAGGIFRIGHETDKPFLLAIKQVQAIPRSNPKHAETIFINRFDAIAAQTVGIDWVVEKIS